MPRFDKPLTFNHDSDETVSFNMLTGFLIVLYNMDVYGQIDEDMWEKKEASRFCTKYGPENRVVLLTDEQLALGV